MEKEKLDSVPDDKNINELPADNCIPSDDNVAIINEAEPPTKIKPKRKLPQWLIELAGAATTSDASPNSNNKRIKFQVDDDANTTDTNTDTKELLVHNEDIESSSVLNLPVPKVIKTEIKDEATSTGSIIKQEKFKIKEEPADTEAENPVVDSSTSPSIPSTSSTNVNITVKSEATTSSRDSCKYGIRCYRRNDIHRRDEAHPGDNDYRRPNYPAPPPGTPECPFGDCCYRRNPIHFIEYSHPSSTDFQKNRLDYKKRLRDGANKTNYVDAGSGQLDDFENNQDDSGEDFIDDGSESHYSENDNSTDTDDSNF